ncbi:MAG: hypothetical protein CSA42_07385 [Gammaproteobacteria bacterium]|nr:MAG: hypothetical protein CSA42_07385 [Gammaproteobacteria bacterium]
MYYHQAEFTLFEKSSIFNDQVKSPNTYHQLIFPKKKLIIYNQQGEQLEQIPPQCAALIYPLFQFQLSDWQSRSMVDLLSINSFIFGGRLSSNEFFHHINDLLKRNNLSLIIIDKLTTSKLSNIYQRITNEFRLECLLATLEILHLISQSSQLIEIKGIANNNKERFFFNQVNEYIDKNIFNNIGVKDAATNFYASESSFSHRFREIFKTSFHQYFLFKKIEKSCELIRSSEETIQEIGYLLGFSSTSHFIAKFKQIKKMTPGKYRKLSLSMRN